MMTVSRFSRQNDAGLPSLNVVLGENFVLVVESKLPYYMRRALRQFWSTVCYSFFGYLNSQSVQVNYD